MKKVKGKLVRTSLNQDFIIRINEKDKTLSTISTIALPIVIIAVGILVFQNSFKWKNSNTPLFPPGFFYKTRLT